MTGYHVYAPYGSCIVQVSPSGVTVQPLVVKSLRLVGAGVGWGVPEYCTTSAYRSVLRDRRSTTRSLPLCSASTSSPSSVTSPTSSGSPRSSWSWSASAVERQLEVASPSSIRVSASRPGRGRSAARPRPGRRRRGRPVLDRLAERRVEAGSSGPAAGRSRRAGRPSRTGSGSRSRSVGFVRVPSSGQPTAARTERGGAQERPEPVDRFTDSPPASAARACGRGGSAP